MSPSFACAGDVALLGGQRQPARALQRVVAELVLVEIHLADPVLRIGIAEIGRGVHEQLDRVVLVLGDAGFGQAVAGSTRPS